MARSCSVDVCTKDATIRDYCTTCYNRLYYSEVRRPKMIALLGDACVKCGSVDDLHFDHIDPALKSFNIKSNMSPNNPEVRAELAKCQLLCRSCHEAKTARENSGFRHGTLYGWMKKRCRCGSCEKARRDFNQARNTTRRGQNGSRGEYGRPSTHGEQLHYRRGCRCAECRAANTAYARQLQAARV